MTSSSMMQLRRLRMTLLVGLLGCLALAVSVQAIPSPSPVAAPVFGHDKVFGVGAVRFPATAPRTSCKATATTADTIASLRGGQVLEPETLDEVEGILVRAGSEGKLVVIDFSATWCGPCKMIAPLFEQLSDSITDVVFIKIDVDVNPDTAAKYSVSAMPTFLFVKQGEVLDRLMGASPERLQQLIDEHK